MHKDSYFKKTERPDKKFFKTQLTWVPEPGVAKKIPTWASDIEPIKTLYTFFSGAQINKHFKPAKITNAKIKMGLAKLDELEKKFKEFIPKK